MTGPPAAAAAASRIRQDVVRLCHQGRPAVQLLGQVLARLRQVVWFDASLWSTTDPATLLPTGGLVHNLPLDCCQPYFDNELLVADVNKFAELARAARPVGVLSQATGGVPHHSARYQTLGARLGLQDELRVAMVADGGCWGSPRCHASTDGSPPVRPTSSPAWPPTSPRGCAPPGWPPWPRAALGRRGPWWWTRTGRSRRSPQARRWMAELAALTDRIGHPQQPAVPPVVYLVAARARAALAGHDQGLPSARVRTHGGQWLVVHGSLLLGPHGPDGRAAVVIEPARPAQIAPVIVAAFKLTGREQDVLRLVCQGLGTDQIAQALFLSPHTVRGYLKDLFAKVGVTSRGELVARLFTDHYHDQLTSTASIVKDPA